MPKVILEFETGEEMQTWLGYWHDGGGEDGMWDAWQSNEPTDYPNIKVTEEK